MIRFLGAFAWLRWRILINTMKGGRRRDTLERLSRISAIVLPIVIYLCFGILAVGLAGLALAGGYLIGSDSSDTQAGQYKRRNYF